MISEIELARTLGTAMGKLIGKGVELWSKDKIFKDIAELVKESLARELRLASVLIDEYEKVKDDDKTAQAFLDCIEIKAFEAISRAGIPLSRILPDPLDESFWGKLKLNALESNYVSSTDAGYRLIEKTYLRLKVFTIRRKIGHDRTKLDYLKKLLRASIKVLTGQDE